MAGNGEKTLQELLREANVTQREIAEMLGVHESTVSLKISGQRTMSLEEAGIFARRLGVTVDDILCALDFAKRKVNERTVADSA